MDETEREKMSPEERDVARLLRAIGPRETMPEELKARWERQFRKELQPVLQKRRARRYTAMGLIASVVAVGLVTALGWQAPREAAPRIEVVSVSGDSRVTQTGHSARALRTGQSLSVEETIATGEGSFAALNYGGYDLRLNSGTQLQFAKGGISLESGKIYISNEAGGAERRGITVLTPFGSVEDIGTQFTVNVHALGAVSTVRRGTIVVSTGDEHVRAQAAAGSARQISFDSTQLVQLSDGPASGPDWEWIYNSSPGFVLEGQTVAAFLQWSSRESGMHLKYTTESAEIYARTTILHGDIMDLNPDQAVEPVLAGTHLEARRKPDNTLHITLQRRH